MPTPLRKARSAVRRLGWAVDKYVTPSYSQEGEDRILARFFEQQNVGTYIDVGAHHPRRFSNTHLLYLRGWSGLNIDPLPGTKALFDRERPRDINVEAGIATQEGSAEFFRFAEPALSTFDPKIAEWRRRQGHKLVATIAVPVQPLRNFLPLLKGRAVDLLTVDVEGRDADVLASADLSTLRPRIVCVEIDTEASIQPGEAERLLTSLGYRLIAMTGLSRLFELRPA